MIWKLCSGREIGNCLSRTLIVWTATPQDVSTRVWIAASKIKERLKKYLHSDKRQNDLVPPGVIDRATALGWVERRFTILGKDLGVFWRG